MVGKIRIFFPLQKSTDKLTHMFQEIIQTQLDQIVKIIPTLTFGRHNPQQN